MRYLRILIVLLALLFCLQGCADSQPSQDTDVLSHLLDDYSKAIENGVPADMSLTVYNNIVPYIRSDQAITKDDLMKTPKTVIDSVELSSRIVYLKKIDSLVLQEPEKSLPKDLMVYYCIETETAGKVLEVEISGKGGTIFVNGTEVKYDPAFFELVSPYLDAWEYMDGGTKTDMLSHLLDDYSKAIENGVPADMSLTLYNMGPYDETDIAVRKAYLIKTPKTVIDSVELSSRIDQLKKIDSSVLREPQITPYKDLRIYYYIETETAGIVLDVEMNGIGGSIFVNGMEVDYDPVFFDLVSPYLIDAWQEITD